MQNLKDNSNLNVLTQEEQSEIWIPVVIFENNDESERLVVDNNALIIVKKVEEEGFSASSKELNAAEVFLGDINPLIYRRTFSTKFDCSFNLRYYPFDTQECVMHLKVPMYYEDIVELVASNISYTGPSDLNQFEVIKIKNATINGQALFIMILRRRYTYQLVSVYIPSGSLLLITLVTGFIDTSKHFESNIMVRLTNMLVMYTLFQALSISLPQVIFFCFRLKVS